MVSDGSAQAPTASMQLVVQAVPAVQALPVLLHVSGVLPLQRVAPGVHAPVHSPPEQLTAHDCSPSHAVPVELQTSTWLPLHRREPAAQVTVAEQALVAGSHDCAHTCCVCQVPL